MNTDIVYPRWIHHPEQKAFVVQSAEEAKDFYDRGWSPFPIRDHVVSKTAAVTEVALNEIKKANGIGTKRGR